MAVINQENKGNLRPDRYRSEIYKSKSVLKYQHSAEYTGEAKQHQVNNADSAIIFLINH